MERVVPWELDVTWEPNAPEAVLLSSDDGFTALALNAHMDDEDQRAVVLTWSSKWAQMAEPNGEALPGHRLYDAGLKTVLWGGVVENSELVRALGLQDRVMFRDQADGYRLLTHYVLPLKECVVEVAGEGLTVERADGATVEAAAAVITRLRR